MPRFKAAHIREQGIDLIIIPLESSFHHKSQQEQTEIIDELQTRANAAGLAGTVVPVWTVGSRMGFIAPPNWHPFFKASHGTGSLETSTKRYFGDDVTKGEVIWHIRPTSST